MVGRTGDASPVSPAVVTPLPSPAIKWTRMLRAPFHFVHTAGVVTRTRNVSEYMLVLPLCLLQVVFTQLSGSSVTSRDVMIGEH